MAGEESLAHTEHTFVAHPFSLWRQPTIVLCFRVMHIGGSYSEANIYTSIIDLSFTAVHIVVSRGDLGGQLLRIGDTSEEKVLHRARLSMASRGARNGLPSRL